MFPGLTGVQSSEVEKLPICHKCLPVYRITARFAMPYGMWRCLASICYCHDRQPAMRPCNERCLHAQLQNCRISSFTPSLMSTCSMGGRVSITSALLIWCGRVSIQTHCNSIARPLQDISGKAALQQVGLLARRGCIICGVQQLPVVISHIDLACMPQLGLSAD